MTKNSNDDDNDSDSNKAHLPSLLQALALGARASNALPLSKKIDKNSDNDDSSSDDDDENANNTNEDDEYAYQMAFPEFRQLNKSTKKVLHKMLKTSLIAANPPTSDNEDDEDDDDTQGVFDVKEDDDDDSVGDSDNDNEEEDVQAWEECADACDFLLDRIERHVLFMKGDDVMGSSLQQQQKQGALKNTAHVKRVNRGFASIVSNLADIEKSQITFSFLEEIDNTRTKPFIPHLPKTPKPFGLTEELSNTPIPGHGLNLQFLQTDEHIVAPDVHYGHPYQDEIDQLEFRPWQFTPPVMGGEGEATWDDSLPKEGVGGTLHASTKKPSSSKKHKSKDDSKKETTNKLSFQWIDNLDDLQTFASNIVTHDIRELAVDLEAHSYRSYSGFVCLMQLSVRWPANTTNKTKLCNNILIDTLKLRSHIGVELSEIFANPNICKVMHGADSDIPWLQRDFNISVVNLFDTYQAAKYMELSGLGLAFLLSKYAGVNVDKRHQLSDWRIRPIPIDMLEYACADTHYLLDVYDAIRADLVCYVRPVTTVAGPLALANAIDSSQDKAIKQPEKEEEEEEGGVASIRKVLNESRKTSLIRYHKDPFRPLGYKKLLQRLRGHQKESDWTDHQKACLALLYDWRDEKARHLDESSQYVVNNSGLLRLAQKCPDGVVKLRNVLNPLPSVVKEYAHEVIALIQRSAMTDDDDDGADEANAPFSPPSAPHASGILSPVLGTAALYKQAGWTTPVKNEHGNTTPMIVDQNDYSNVKDKDSILSPKAKAAVAAMHAHINIVDDSDSSSSTSSNHNSSATRNKNKCLSVHTLNANYESSRYTSHSLELASSSSNDNDKNNRGVRGVTVDGLGAIRFASSNDTQSASSSSSSSQTNDTSKILIAEKEAKQANETAMRIRSNLKRDGNKGLNFITMPSSIMIDDDGGDNVKQAQMENEEKMEEEDQSIPKSMSEIYQISNRNKWKNNQSSKKHSKNKQANQNDEKELEKAEELLAQRGQKQANNNDDEDGYFPSRTKRQKSQQQQKDDVKTENAKIMKDIGWVENESDVQDMEKEISNLSPDMPEKKPKKQSKTNMIGALGYGGGAALPSNNPFFAGVATSGSSFQDDSRSTKKNNGSNKQGRKRHSKGGNGNKGTPAAGGAGGGKKRVMEQANKQNSNKTFVYRKNQGK